MKALLNKPKRATIKRWLVSAPEYVVACYDNGGKTADRYTVLIGGSLHDPILDSARAVAFLGMSETPFSPQGVSMWGEMPRGNGRVCGKKVAWLELPEHTRKHVISRCKN